MVDVELIEYHAF